MNLVLRLRFGEMERDQMQGLSSIKNTASLLYFIGNTSKLREHLVMTLVLNYLRNQIVVLVNY
jgi:hypothetical protein